MFFLKFETFIKTPLKLVYILLKSFFRKLKGEVLYKVSLGSMTLDKDDIKIANSFLRKEHYQDDLSLIEKFESEFCKWNNSSYAFSFLGGRVALSACIYGLDLKKGDSVIIPGYSCVVVPNAFWYQGIEVIFADIELETFGLDLDDVRKKIKKNTKAILLHHLFGLVCRDFEKILEFGKLNSLYIIEDCAHATGAKFKGVNVGNFGDVSFYSSEQSKVFNTHVGGITVTNNGIIADRIKEFQQSLRFPSKEKTFNILRSLKYNYYSKKSKFKWIYGELLYTKYKQLYVISTTKEEISFNKPEDYLQRMPAPVAAIGLNQLKKINNYNNIRLKNASYWKEWCMKEGYSPPKVIDNSNPVFLRYPVLVSEEMKSDNNWSKSLNVELGVWFTTNIHPAIYPVNDCPQSDLAVKTCINFPTIFK